MHNSNKENKHVKDGIDLEEFQKKTIRLKHLNEIIIKDKKTLGILFTLSVVLMLCVVFFAVQEYGYRAELDKNVVTNELAREIVEIPISTEKIEPPLATSVPVTEDIKAVETEAPIVKVVLEKIEKLREAFSNEDIMGYLKIEGTNIDYAVAQYSDNDYYLVRDLYGNSNIAGSLFMDYECDTYELSKNTVIYGHNMRNGSMFHNIRYYSDSAYFEDHRYISLTTPYEETMWEVFAFYKTTTDFYYIQVIFPDDSSFASLVSEMKMKSAYDTGVEVGANDKILTLSTCASTSDGARYVLNAKLLEE